MKTETFRAGAAAVSLNPLLLKYFQEEDKPLEGEKGQQKIRCLIFDSGSRLTVLLNSDAAAPSAWPHQLSATVQEAMLTVYQQLEPKPRPVDFIFAHTHNHTGPFLPPPLRQARKRHWLSQQVIQSAGELFRQAYSHRQEVHLTLGTGRVSSISANSDVLNGDFDPNVYVLRIDNTCGDLVAAVVNFACHATASYEWNPEMHPYLTADFPGAMEEVVQKVYGDVPILFLNGAAGDAHPAVRRIPDELVDVPRMVYARRYAANRWRETNRIGRVLGGEVCKVLAELEVAGEELGVRCDRWGYVHLHKPSLGLVLSNPSPLLKTESLLLPCRNATVADCESHVRELERQLKEAEAEYSFPYPPNQKKKFLLRSENEPLWKIMDLHARLERWTTDLKRARAGMLSPAQVKIGVLGISREVGAICCPLEMHYETMQKIRERSPFTTTLMIGYVSYPGESRGGSYLTTSAKLELGGYHSGIYNPEAEEIAIRQYVQLLEKVRAQLPS